MKKIATNTVKMFLKEHKHEDSISVMFPVADSEFEVKIRTSLSESEKSVFISRVLSGCFDYKDDFRPEYVSSMLRATVLQMCTNLPVMTLKNERGDDGGSLMDIEAMNELYLALDLDHLDNKQFQVFLGEIVHLCTIAIEWKKSRVLAKDGAPDVSAFTTFGEAMSSVREAAKTITDTVSKLNIDELMEYAAQLSKATEGMDEGGVVRELVSLHSTSQ